MKPRPLVFALTGLAWPCLSAPLPRGDWVAHGFPEGRRAELERFLSTSYERGHVVGGTVLLVHAGEVVFEQAFGFADIKRRRPFEMSTPCSVASISKPIVATLVVKLASEGRVELDSPIDRYLPQYGGIRLRSGQEPRGMPRLQELLRHTAGFTPDKEEGGRPWFWEEARGKTLEEMVALYPDFPIRGLYCNPGGGCWYSGMGYDVAGRIVEVATGEPIHKVLRKELCEPLGMSDTCLLPDAELRARAPSRYYQRRSDGSFHRRIPKPPPSVADGDASSPYTPIGGGVLSTPADLAAFLMLHRDRGKVAGVEFIPETVLRRMHERKRPWPRYGMGFQLGPGVPELGGHTAWIRHSGSSGTVCWLDFEHDVVGVILTQTERSRGRAMPEEEKLSPKAAPTFPEVVKSKIDAVFGWRAWPPPTRGR